MPKYREDIKGQVAEMIREFVDALRGETAQSEAFHFGTDDEIRETEAYQRYRDYLTDPEMIRAAKKMGRIAYHSA